MKGRNIFMGLLCCACVVLSCTYEQPEYNPIRKPGIDDEQQKPTPPDPENPKEDIDLNEWELLWADEFTGTDTDLDAAWSSENGPAYHILCSRWRENAVISNGTLKLVNKKESRGGQDWTAASLTSKTRFKYGYFECRYRYAKANAINNSFWLSTSVIEEGKKFEIDVNEGKYPNKIATNLWDNSSDPHIGASKTFFYGSEPGYSIQLETPITTQKIRFSSNNSSYFHIREFRLYNVLGSYPNPLSETADRDVPGLQNFATPATIRVSGTLNNTDPYAMVDGKITTSWISQAEGEKWIEMNLAAPSKIGCIQFVNGWLDNGNWTGLISDYKLQYYDGNQWVDIATKNIENEFNFADEFHTYGLEWTREYIIYYFDRREIRRIENQFCYSAAPVILSSAIISWDGPVTDAIDGTQMEVDYVRIYKRKE